MTHSGMQHVEQGEPVDVGGIGGPFRRLSTLAVRDRAILVAVKLVGSVLGGVGYWALSRAFGDDPGWFGLAWFSVWMFVVSLYSPELTKLVRRWND
jgi:hypothetical protein